MPIYVQWEWQEQTKTFLVIFHFLDDFSATNLRAKMKKIKSHKDWTVEHYKTEMKPYLTWDPSHPELGLLSEVLSYANIINGLNYDRKRKFRDLLEGKRIDFALLPKGRWLITSEIEENGNEKLLFYKKELNTEYIDYLRKLLEPYLK